MDIFAFVLLSSSLLLFFFLVSDAANTDSITKSQSLSEGMTLVSKDGSYALGFFSPGNSGYRYLGIWYNNIPVRTVVWVANRLNPINDSSGMLVAWNPIVQLLDSGNLVLREENEENPEKYLWQSFDYPSDTWLPGMKLGWDLRTGLERRLSTWKSPDDPSPGELSWGIELHNYPKIVMNKGTEKFFRTGPWNGLGFSGVPDLKDNPVYTYDFVINSDEVYFIYNMIKNSVISRALLNETSSSYERYIWVSEDKKWSLYLSMPKDKCEGYNLCGPYGNCIIDTTYSWVNGSLSLDECRVKCLNNCSCTAYANSDIKNGGSGCAMWFGDLIDIRQVAANGQDAYIQDVYIRMNASEQVNHKEEKDKQKVKVIVIVVVAIAVVFGVLLIPYCICKRTNFREKMENNVMIDQNIEGQSEDMEVPFFTLATIVIATNNFSSYNKLGEGGFGLVYKGTLIDRKEIAVKRLSPKSGQGLSEFKNEVILITKLQHQNLVRLLGYCIEGDEKMLIYEYMPNGSLDSLIFDQMKAKVLGWSMRFNIICGIARGLLYLHEDSRLRIIHRDLKASNVLLDSKMNPKISDFGMARIFGGDQIEGNTNRVVGTYGYMAPEYAIDGLFSVKSDVFSFGILLLEIISGKKN
ncbi:hypothetical protein CMV_004011 [Castanea mollissima]|uniref:Non-specific serine/threonine protein kinase n=1 Tax=Castanea mollissima TaxID=60419 RepID=A0A8J4VVY7_9ROSI|nr:hypothetical protein CMV_004011 [Castanea mollissima]